MIVSIDRVCRLLELLHVIDICDWSVLAPGVDARTQAGRQHDSDGKERRTQPQADS